MKHLSTISTNATFFAEIFADMCLACEIFPGMCQWFLLTCALPDFAEMCLACQRPNTNQLELDNTAEYLT